MDLEVAAGRYAAADSILAAFALAHPTSGDSLDVLLWRALYLLDPGNPDPDGPTTALGYLDRYLAAQVPQERLREAQVLRRLATLRVTPPPVRRDTVFALDSAALRAALARELETHDKLRDEEMVRVRDSLTRATAELDRIRRRLAPRRP